MLNKAFKRYLKIRIISSFVDALLFFVVFNLSFIYLLHVLNMPTYWLFPYLLVLFFVYYSIIPKLTGGYTLSGIFFGLKIIKINNKPIKLREYFFRSFYAIFSYIRFFGYARVRVNKLGQLYFDKPFNITVVGKGYSLPLTIDKTSDFFSFYFLAE